MSAKLDEGGLLGVKSDAGTDEELDSEIDYEQERLENIRNNAALLASLGLNATPSIRPHKPSIPPQTKVGKAQRQSVPTTRRLTRRAAAEPTRRSGRVAALQENASYNPSYDLSRSPSPPPRKPALPRSSAPVLAPAPEYDPSIPLSPASRPTRRADGTLVFEGRWAGVFTPNLTPEEMFAGGAFGGGFFTDTYSHVLRTPLASSSVLPTLPFTFSDQDTARLLTNGEPDGEVNRFGVRAGQSLQEWEKAGWIWSGDPRGWAEWYVRFWAGRRCEDDERQVRRWLKVAGPTGRFKRALLKKVQQSGGRGALRDEDVGRVLRQCLWQWGYELTESEYDRAMAGEG